MHSGALAAKANERLAESHSDAPGFLGPSLLWNCRSTPPAEEVQPSADVEHRGRSEDIAVQHAKRAALCVLISNVLTT